MRWCVSIAVAVVGVALIAGVLREHALVDARAHAIEEARAASRALAGGYEVVLPAGMGFAPESDLARLTR